MGGGEGSRWNVTSTRTAVWRQSVDPSRERCSYGLEVVEGCRA